MAEKKAAEEAAVVTVFAPNPRYAGISAGHRFVDGRATVSRSNTGALGYFRRAGYQIDGKAPKDHDLPAWDAREARVVVGSPLRDAAVEPAPTDFLPPTRAGEADPHGPLVVAPQVHASGPKGVRPGRVDVDAPAEQSADETELAERVLVNNEPKPEVLAEIGAEENRDQHQREAAAAEAAAERRAGLEPGTLAGEHDDDGRPARNASRDAWAAWAVERHGMDAEEAELATRGELIERFGGE